MNKPFKTLSTAALAAVFASSALVPVASAEVAPAQAASLSKIIVEYNGQNVALTVSDYSDLLDAGKINPATVKYVELSTGDKYTLDAYSEALDAFSNVEDTAEYLAEKDTPSEVKDVKDGTIKDGEIQVEDETPSTEIKVESVSAINNNGVTVTFPALTGDITGANVVVKDPAGNTVATVAQNLSKGATSATFPFTAAQTSLAAGTWTVDGKEILVKSQDAGLQNLVSNVGIWNEDFAENKLEGALNYTVNVKSDVSSIQLTPTVAEGATIIASTTIQSSPTATPVTNRYSFTNNEATTINLSHAGATTPVFITVVAPDGKTSKTYTINVARAVANADNSAVLGGVTLTPNPTGTINGYTFQPTVENYELNVANAVEAVTVAPTGVTGTVYVNGEETTSSKLVALAQGKNTITVKVIAADNVTTKTYTYTINRAAASASNVTTLNSITLNTGTLNSFEADTTNATANASVVHTTTDLTITPVATNAKATVAVTAVKMASVPASAATTRDGGFTTAYATETNRLTVEKAGVGYTVKGLQVTEPAKKNVVEIAVTAEDGSVYYHYFEVKRAAAAASSISTLASVGFTADTSANIVALGSTAPTAQFNAATPFKASTLAYTKNVENTHAAFAINPTATNGSADVVVKVNGIKLTKNTDGYFTGSLIVGQNTITVDVTAANGIDKSTYTYTVNRAQAGASAVKTLATLTSNVGTLTGFVADTTPTAPVTLGVTNTTSEVTITPTASNANATITVEAVKAAANTTLATTANAKTAYDGVTAASNKLTVEKNGSAFTIKGLQIENTTANTTNIAKVTVAPADGSTPEEYYVVIKRAQANASDNAGLAATTGIQYNLGAGATSITGFAPTKTSYDLVASYLQDSIIITPAEGTAGQVITVNGKVVATGTPSDALPLAIGKNEIKVAVVAPNGTTTNTYTLNVTRIANPDASSTKTLSSITTDGVLSGFTANTLPTASANNAIVAKVANNTESITITPKVADSKATVKVTAASGLDSDKTSTNGVTTFQAGKGTALTVTENAGAFTITGLKAAGSGATAQKNLVQVTVTAEDGSTQAYTIDVQRVAAGLSASSKLTDLTFVDAAGSPVDFSNTNEYTFNANTNEYSIVAPNGVENIKFTATAATGSHIKAVADNASEPIFDGLVSGTTADVTASLAAGGTTKVTFTVTSADLTSTSTYTVNVNRAPFNAATTATLSNLTFPGYTYTYVSGTDAVITVADEASLLKFVPTVTGTNARVVVKSADDAKYAVSKAADGTYTVSLKTGTSAFPANGAAAAVAEVYVVTEAGVATKANTIKAQITTPSVLAGITGKAVTTQGVAPVTEEDATVGGLTFKLGTDLDGYKIKLGTIDDGTTASATVDTITKVITLNGDFDNTDTNSSFISASEAKSAIETATSKTLTSVTGTAVATATATESGVYVAPVTGVTEKVAITITGTATSAGTLTVVAGTKTYNITVANGAVQNDVATAIHTAINADAPAGYTSSVATNVVTLTSTTLNDNVADLTVTIN